MKAAAFITLGCKVNQCETENMIKQFTNGGWSIVDGPADVFVINTCSVTAVADKKSRQAIRRAKSQNPGAVVVVTGCFAQLQPELLSNMEQVDLILSNREKDYILPKIEKHLQDIGYHGPDTVTVISPPPYKTRAFLKVQDGCTNFCAYCIIPYARGTLQSTPLQDVVAQANQLGIAGYREIVLTGIHLASYGIEHGRHDLYDLLFALQNIPGIDRVRLGSLEMTPILHKIAQNAHNLPKLCNHFHISLQSGCDATLHRMKRRYSAAQYHDAILALRQHFPGAAITTDFMVGFPGETEDEFLQSLHFAKTLGFAKMHVFPYSVREGTLAATMADQIPADIKKERAKQASDLAFKMEQNFHKTMLGETENVLFEQGENGCYYGYTTNYTRAKAQCSHDISGQILPVLLDRIDENMICATLV